MVFRLATALLFLVVYFPLEMTTSPETALHDIAPSSPQVEGVATVVVKRFQKKTLPVTSQDTPEPDFIGDPLQNALSQFSSGTDNPVSATGSDNIQGPQDSTPSAVSSWEHCVDEQEISHLS